MKVDVKKLELLGASHWWQLT